MSLACGSTCSITWLATGVREVNPSRCEKQKDGGHSDSSFFSCPST